MDEVLNAEAPDAPRVEAAERPRRLEIWLPLVIVVLDQLSKAAIRATLPLHQSVTIIPLARSEGSSIRSSMTLSLPSSR